jgi:hypothetical protein
MKRHRLATLLGLLLILAAVPTALAGKGSGGGATTTCTPAAPGVAVQNNTGWGQSGSWGMPGQRLGFQILVSDLDSGCGSGAYTMTVSAPDGFTVSIPTSSFTLRAGGSVYLWAYVTSPSLAADGNYALTVTVTRSGAGGSTSQVTNYGVYSSDSTEPTLWFNNPANGEVLSGNSYTFAVWTKDDHAVQRVELYIDGALKTTTMCENVTYICALNYKWSIGRQRGPHTATFTAYDWKGNPGSLTVGFTVG